jgi:hypothetical protein
VTRLNYPVLTEAPHAFLEACDWTWTLGKAPRSHSWQWTPAESWGPAGVLGWNADMWLCLGFLAACQVEPRVMLQRKQGKVMPFPA